MTTSIEDELTQGSNNTSMEEWMKYPTFLNQNSEENLLIYMQGNTPQGQGNPNAAQTSEEFRLYSGTISSNSTTPGSATYNHLLIDPQQHQQIHYQSGNEMEVKMDEMNVHHQQIQQQHVQTQQQQQHLVDHHQHLQQPSILISGSGTPDQQVHTPQQQTHTPQQQVHTPQQDDYSMYTFTPIKPPSPPPLPVHLTHHYSLVPAEPVNQQQIQQQQKKLRPITERREEDKKKEALAFLNFYFRIDPTKKTATVSRTSILALYTNKTPVDKRYKQPNDMANLCGAVYTFIFQHLKDDTVIEYIKIADNERLSAKNDLKKRKRKKSHDISDSFQDVNYHDAFLTCIKYAAFLPFIEFIKPQDLNSPSKLSDPYISSHPDWSYTIEDLQRWELDLKDSKINQKSRFSPIPIINEDDQNNNQSNNNNNTSATITTSNSFTKLPVYNQNPQQNNSLFIQNCNTSSPPPNLINTNTNTNNSNNNNNNNNFFNLNSFGSPGGSLNIPVNVTETNENFIIYAFIPFYKPNALTIKVNQMDIILKGTISLPDTILIPPNGSEIPVPSNFNAHCSQQDILEGSFEKVIKLTHPIASSTVGKRDGVVVIIAKKEEGQTTIHQL